MSKKILFGVLDTIKLLLVLSPDKFITSSVIRKSFPTTKYNTLYKKLKTLLQQGYLEVLEKPGEFAGDDRTEYKLTPSGEQIRNKLVTKMQEMLHSKPKS